MNDKEALTPEDQQDLVAYLDGELNPKAARELEAKLNRNPAARQEAQKLQRAWELLDYLPQPRVAENFTQRTVERLRAQQQTLIARLQDRRWLALAGWTAGPIAAGLLGFLLVFYWPEQRVPEPTREEVRLLENRPYYEKIGSMDFLRALDDPDLFGEDS